MVGKKIKRKKIFVIGGNYAKFKLQCPGIKFGDAAIHAHALLGISAAFAPKRRAEQLPQKPSDSQAENIYYLALCRKSASPCGG